METQPEDALQQWATHQCPFTIEYAPRALDDIRLAVMDAFFSLPRGGAEIGGLLVGRAEKGRVTITSSIPIECEHAFGPSFTLSPRDHEKLEALLAAEARNPSGRPVGWWHSHTRSELNFTEADQEVHQRFFPEPWHVALVLKPHTFHPMRGGFFFREKGGAIHGEAPYLEFTLTPLPVRAVPTAPPSAADGIDVSSVPEPEPEPEPAPIVESVPIAAPAPAAAPAGIPPPPFTAAPERLSRSWTSWAAIALGAALGFGIYQTSPRWLPRAQTMLRAAPPEAVALNTIDQGGQLQIRWNGAAPDASRATGGSLLILDGSRPFEIQLDPAHIQSGAFTYARQSGHVDVTLVLAQLGGREVRLATLFTGAPPAGSATQTSDPAVDQERGALAAENARLKSELARQVERERELEQALGELRKVVQRDQQRKRLANQSPDTVK